MAAAEVDLKGKFQFRSFLRPELWQAWQKFSRDPEKRVMLELLMDLILGPCWIWVTPLPSLTNHISR
jgi:hypothetical protein